MSNAYTLISQEYSNTYIQFGDGNNTSNPDKDTQTLELSGNNKPIRILYSQNDMSGYKTTDFYKKFIL